MKNYIISASIAASFASAGPAVAQTKPAIAVIVKDTTSVYWQTVLAGAHKAGLDLGVDVLALGPQSESDAIGQIGILEKAVASNPAAIVIAPAQFAALGKPIDEAAKKIKIIGIDSAADTKAMTSLLATDNVDAGRIAADALAVAITKSYADTEGDVAIIGSKSGVASLDQRTEGFRDVLAAKYRALAIVADKVADGDPARIRQIMKDVIAGDDDLRGVFVSDPVAARAVAQVVSEKTTGDLINIVAVGSDDKLVELLQAGLIAGIVVEDPFRMGYDGVKIALAASKGEQVSAHIDTGAMLLTKANLGSVQAHELPSSEVK